MGRLFPGLRSRGRFKLDWIQKDLVYRIAIGTDLIDDPFVFQKMKFGKDLCGIDVGK